MSIKQTRVHRNVPGIQHTLTCRKPISDTVALESQREGLEKDDINFQVNRFVLSVCVIFITTELQAQLVCGVGSSVPSIRTQMDWSDVIVIGKVVSTQPARAARNFEGMSVIALQEFEKGHATEFVAEQLITIPYHLDVPKSKLLRIPGQFDENGNFYWGLADHHDLSSQAFQYVIETPARFESEVSRLSYYFKWLEHADSLIAEDAFREFEDASISEIYQLRHLFDEKALRKWLRKTLNSEADSDRFVLYAIMLAACGKQTDFEALIHVLNSDDFQSRFDQDLVLSAILMISCNSKLDLIGKESLSKRLCDELWTPDDLREAFHFVRNLPVDSPIRYQLKQAMRKRLVQNEMIDVAIHGLTSWEDWTVVDQVAEAFQAEGDALPATRRAVFRYLCTIQTKAMQPDPDQNALRYYGKAIYYLTAFRKIDPEQYQNVRLTYFSDDILVSDE